MATIAVVDGVKIMLYANEHPPPHFHAKFAEFQAVMISTGLLSPGGACHPRRRMRRCTGPPNGKRRCEAHSPKRWRNVRSDPSNERVATYLERRGNYPWRPKDHLQGWL